MLNESRQIKRKPKMKKRKKEKNPMTLMRFAAFSALCTRCRPFWRISGAQVENFLFLIRERFTNRILLTSPIKSLSGTLSYELPKLKTFLSFNSGNFQSSCWLFHARFNGRPDNIFIFSKRVKIIQHFVKYIHDWQLAKFWRKQ